MNRTSLVPTLMVQDVRSTIEFYRTNLGFELAQAIPDEEPLEWVLMRCGMVEIAFQEQANMAFDIPEMQGLPVGSTVNFRMQVEDIRALYDRIKDRVEISQDIWDFYPDICEFRIRDCNGYFWTFEGKSGSRKQS